VDEVGPEVGDVSVGDDVFGRGQMRFPRDRGGISYKE